MSRFGAILSLSECKELAGPYPQSECPLDTRFEWFESLNTKEKNQKEQILFLVFWSECRDSNSRPLEPHSSAIPNFATPGTNYAASLTTSTYYHVIRKMSSANFHFFHFLSPISRNQREMGKLQTYSPRSLVTTLPMFHRWATACSASFFS